MFCITYHNDNDSNALTDKIHIIYTYLYEYFSWHYNITDAGL